MKISLASVLTLALAADTALGSTWFGKAVYNKWHETELERWLSDHDIPYPTPADRKDLENLVKTNWDAAVASPYMNWDANRLQKQLEAQGAAIKKGTEKNKDELVKQVQATWRDTAESADKGYENIKDWIFDSWSDSQIKSFADTHGIPVPQPSKRDEALAALRANYHQAAKGAGEYAQYPGNWLYEGWSDSDIKAWLDARGIPVPQPGHRDKLIAQLRRNSRVASLNVESAANSAVHSANAAAQSATDTILDSWSDSQIKEFFDKNGIKVPQGSTRNELLAIARKNAAKLTGDNVSDKASAHVGAATSSAGNEYAKASEDVVQKASKIANDFYSQAIGYVDDVQIALGLKTNLASSASKSAASASKSASSLKAKVSKEL